MFIEGEPAGVIGIRFQKGKFRADEMELAQSMITPPNSSRMGKQSFYELARKTSAKFVILTTYDTDNEIYGAIKAGARGICSRTSTGKCYSKVFGK